MLRVRTVISASLGGGPYLNTFYFTGDDDASGAADAVDKVGDFWDAVDDVMDASYTWATEAEVAIMTNAGVITGVHSVTPRTGSGSASGDPVPLATQGLIRWSTNGFPGGRRLRGRTFVPGAVETDSTDGKPGSAYLAALAAAATALATTTGVSLAIWSPTNSVSFTVTSSSVWDQWAVLRSRRD